MTNFSSPQDRAAADALNILGEQTEFDDLQNAMPDLAYAVPLVPLPANLKDRLFDRLDRTVARPANLLDLLDWPVADLQQVATDLPTWESFPMPIGTKRVIWQVDEINAQVAFFLKIPTAGTLPHHWHATGESILVLAGNFIDDDGTVYDVGEQFVAAANTSHQPTTSIGCLILGITSIHDKILAVNNY
jgi:ChrR Cupin-like domain